MIVDGLHQGGVAKLKIGRKWGLCIEESDDGVRLTITGLEPTLGSKKEERGESWLLQVLEWYGTRRGGNGSDGCGSYRGVKMGPQFKQMTETFWALDREGARKKVVRN